MELYELIDYEKELHARQNELKAYLKDWTPRGGDMSFTWYRRYVDSGYVTNPFGSVHREETWWTDDFNHFELKVELNSTIPQLLRDIEAHKRSFSTK